MVLPTSRASAVESHVVAGMGARRKGHAHHPTHSYALSVHARHHLFTVTDYVRLENETGIKHEFLAGQVWAMAEGRVHMRSTARTCSRCSRERCATSRAPCTASDLRLGVRATGLLTYADVTVICGRVQVDRNDPTKHTVTNPRVVVEVLSPSTEDYDRGDKLGHYKTIPSLKEVVFVAHDRREVEVVRRERDGSWSRHVATMGQSAKLASLHCELSVAAVYHDPLERKARRSKT